MDVRILTVSQSSNPLLTQNSMSEFPRVNKAMSETPAMDKCYFIRIPRLSVLPSLDITLTNALQDRALCTITLVCISLCRHSISNIIMYIYVILYIDIQNNGTSITQYYCSFIYIYAINKPLVTYILMHNHFMLCLWLCSHKKTLYGPLFHINTVKS